MSSVAFYTKLAATAARLITKLGTQIPCTRQLGGFYDPITGNNFDGFNRVFTPNGIVKNFASDQIDGTRILASDQLLILDATTDVNYIPAASDKIRIENEVGTGFQEWLVIDIITKQPTVQPIVYFVQVRK